LGLTDEEVPYAFEFEATFKFLVSENFSAHTLVPQVLFIDRHRFRCGVNVDDAWRETLLELVCVLGRDRFFRVEYH
jgi:hypothetical protein